jgi:hypothetical protein
MVLVKVTPILLRELIRRVDDARERSASHRETIPKFRTREYDPDHNGAAGGTIG